ncbi:MAG: type II/IV secretion system ATPase subunit [Candidatus Bathyarchaeia archaeon]
MRLNFKFRKEKAQGEEAFKEMMREEGSLVEFLDIKKWNVPEGYVEVEYYPLKPPFSYAAIVQNEETMEYLYVLDELPITKEERDGYFRLRNILEYELQAPEGEETLAESFKRQMPLILSAHQKLFTGISPVGMRKILYYLERDIVGYGKIDPLMYDEYVEDIGCSGVNKPIFLWHRKYENIKTNIVFRDEQELDDFIMRVVHKAGKHVSIAFPIVDVTLPEKHRLAVSFGKETTPAGTSFTIRKFRKDPFTIIDLIENETIDENIAAYLWLLMENKMSLMIIGATGAGKTTALNAIACLIKPSHKIISVEEVAEINLPHENWTSTIARSGFGVEGEGEITLYDLIKSAVRHRPDLIIVGEVRGEEAYVLFQALATGHGGLCTLHAEDVDTAIKRLTQPPMNIPSSIIPLMNCVINVKHVRTPVFLESGRRLSSRKFINVSEIKDANSFQEVFSWNPSNDTFQERLAESYLLKKMAASLDIPVEKLLDELEYRKRILMHMVEHNIRDYRSVNKVLSKYYNNPQLFQREFLENFKR